MAKIPLSIRGFGSPPTTEISPFAAGENQLVVCDGCDPTWMRGSLTSDAGYKEYAGLALAQPVFSLASFFGGVKAIAATNNPDGDELRLWRDIGSGLTQVTASDWDAYPNHFVEACAFLDYLFMVGWDKTSSYLPPATLKTADFSITDQLTNAPKGKYIVNYRDRLYVLGVKVTQGPYTAWDVAIDYIVGDRVTNGGVGYECKLAHLSDAMKEPPNSTYWVPLSDEQEYPHRACFSNVPVAGQVTWNNDVNFLDVDYSEQITGGCSAFDRLIIFTPTSAWLYDQNAFKKQHWAGCANHRSIQVTDAYVLYASQGSVWATTGGRPANVSVDISELIMNSDSAVWQSCYNRNENTYSIYLGDTSANGESFPNCMATLSLDMLAEGQAVWRWRSLGHDVFSMAELNSDDGYRLAFGSTYRIYMKSQPNDATPTWSDNGLPITARFRTKWLDGGDPSTVKTFTGALAYGENLGGLELWWRKMDRGLDKPSAWQRIDYTTTDYSRLNKSISGNFIQIEGRWLSTRQGFALHGITLLAQADGKED